MSGDCFGDGHNNPWHSRGITFFNRNSDRISFN